MSKFRVKLTAIVAILRKQAVIANVRMENCTLTMKDSVVTISGVQLVMRKDLDMNEFEVDPMKDVAAITIGLDRNG